MKKEILVCGFKGNRNTSKLLLDNISLCNKLYLENDFDISVQQLLSKLSEKHYDTIIMFGQKPRLKSICLEVLARKEMILLTTYDIANLKCFFINLGYKVNVSKNPGNYLCNNIY